MCKYGNQYGNIAMEHQQEQLTPEQIQRHYNALLDSVAVISQLITGTKNESSISEVRRNVEHLVTMLNQTFWTSEHNMEPINQAIDAGTGFIS